MLPAVRAARDHDGPVLLDFEVDQYRPVMIARRPHRWQHLRALAYRHAADSVASASFTKLGFNSGVAS